MLELREPSLDLAASFESYRDALIREGGTDWRGRKALAISDVPAFVALLNRRANGSDIPDGWVPETTLWVVESDIVVGDVEIRHPLNDWLRQIGGNIGYSSHPEHRNNGVATFALREGLKVLGRMAVHEALVTCRDDNAPSIRVIEKCGGIRIEDSTVHGPVRRRYLIRTTT